MENTGAVLAMSLAEWPLVLLLNFPLEKKYLAETAETLVGLLSFQFEFFLCCLCDSAREIYQIAAGGREASYRSSCQR